MRKDAARPDRELIEARKGNMEMSVSATPMPNDAEFDFVHPKKELFRRVRRPYRNPSDLFVPDNKELEEAEEWLQQRIDYANKRKRIDSYTVTVTPALATALLKRNVENRRISYTKVAVYASEMRSGAWRLNGEPLIVSDTGEMNDGQHRCLAVLEAGVTFDTQITFGPTRESRTTIDLGLKRTVGATLATMGHQNAHELAHTASIILSYQNHKVTEVGPERKPTAQEIIEWVTKNSNRAQDAIHNSAPAAKAFRLSRGMAAALYFIFAGLNENQTIVFFDKLATGENLGASDPILRLRASLQLDLANTRKLSRLYLAAFIIKTWNRYRQGLPAGRVLQWRRAGDTPEPFPLAQ